MDANLEPTEMLSRWLKLRPVSQYQWSVQQHKGACLAVRTLQNLHTKPMGGSHLLQLVQAETALHWESEDLSQLQGRNISKSTIQRPCPHFLLPLVLILKHMK